MTLSTRTVSIIFALLISGSFIALGYFFSSPLSPRFAGAESTDELLAAYAKKDTDADGLPDWQESIYGTDPNDAHSADASMTDGDAVKNGIVKPRFSSEALPDQVVLTEDDFEVPAPASKSFTERFSRAFFERYLEEGGGTALDDAKQQALVTDLLGQFSKESKTLFDSSYAEASVRVSAVSLDAYADVLATSFVTRDVATTDGNPVVLMQALIEQGDESARPKLARLATAYAAIAADLVKAEVPSSEAAYHLALLRSLDSLAKATTMVSRYEEDPVAALGAVSVYEPSAKATMAAFTGIANHILAAGEPPPGTGAAFIVSVARSLKQTP